jgi:hypothetical protein
MNMSRARLPGSKSAIRSQVRVTIHRNVKGVPARKARTPFLEITFMLPERIFYLAPERIIDKLVA